MPGKKPLSIRYCTRSGVARVRGSGRRPGPGQLIDGETEAPGARRPARGPSVGWRQATPRPRSPLSQTLPAPRRVRWCPRGLEPRRRAAGRAFACCPPVAAAGAAADRSRRGRSVGMTRGGVPPGCSAMGRCGGRGRKEMDSDLWPPETLGSEPVAPSSALHTFSHNRESGSEACTGEAGSHDRAALEGSGPG